MGIKRCDFVGVPDVDDIVPWLSATANPAPAHGIRGHYLAVGRIDHGSVVRSPVENEEVLRNRIINDAVRVAACLYFSDGLQCLQ